MTKQLSYCWWSPVSQEGQALGEPQSIILLTVCDSQEWDVVTFYYDTAKE